MSDVTRLSKSTGARGWLAAAALAASAMIPGCQERSASRFDLAAAPAPLVAAGPGAELWAGSQDELAIALDAVAAQVDPGASAALRQRWQGKRVRWSVTRVPALCGPTEPCHVQPFASARRTETSAHGWLPELRFAAGEREKLLVGCGDQPVCEVTVEARIDQLQVSDELPTSVRLSEVRVVAVARS